jgi:hypothetical protein
MDGFAEDSARSNSLGAGPQKHDNDLEEGLRQNMVRGGGGYDTHKKPRLSTGRGVQAWRDPEVGGNGKKINFI